MVTQLAIGDTSVDVVFKDIKNVHLSVYPPTGKVRISAPARMSMETVRAFAISELLWIKKQQKKLLGQERETPREFLNRESHFVWGKRYLLEILERDRIPSIEMKHDSMVLRVRPGADEDKMRNIVEDWYREQIRKVMPSLLDRWQPQIGASVRRIFVRRMKTRWGSCNHDAGTIRLNTELAKKPPECLEYIVVHELIHLLEPTHNARFVDLMDRHMPLWRLRRDELNRAPLAHQSWRY